MIIATGVIEGAGMTPEARQSAVGSELGRLARHRARLERATLESVPGRIVAPAEEAPLTEEHGDLIMFMVDSGQGQALRDRLLSSLEERD